MLRCSVTDAPSQVYDVTKFLDDHPGGTEIMVDVTGRDATDDFEDVVHSSTARKQLEGLYIGELHEDDKAKMRSAGVANAPAGASKASPQAAPNPAVTFIKAILPFLLIAVLFLYQKGSAAA